MNTTTPIHLLRVNRNESYDSEAVYGLGVFKTVADRTCIRRCIARNFRATHPTLTPFQEERVRWLESHEPARGEETLRAFAAAQFFNPTTGPSTRPAPPKPFDGPWNDPEDDTVDTHQFVTGIPAGFKLLGWKEDA